MGVTFDSANSNGGYPPSGVSFSHSLGDGNGNNRIVLVGVCCIGGSNVTVDSCTYNGSAMTLLGTSLEYYFGRTSLVWVYYALDSALPASSGSYTVSATATGDTNPYDCVVVGASWTGVKQSAPPYATDSDQHNPAATGQFTCPITIASDSGMLVDFSGVERDDTATSMSPGSGQTERQDYNYNTAILACSEKAYTSSGADSMAQTPNNSYYSDMQLVVELEDAAAAGSEIQLEGEDGWYGSGTSISQSYTCHAGDNRKLMVCAGGELIGGANVNSVTYNGVGLTKVNEYDGGTHNSVSWWRLDDANFPTTPGSYTLVANFSGSMSPGFMMVMELSGAKQGAVDDENSSYNPNVNTLNTTISTDVDDSWILGFCTTGANNTFTPQSGQTELQDIYGYGGQASACMGYEEIASAGATNMQWGASTTVNRFIQMVVAISPVVESEGNSIIVGTNF